MPVYVICKYIITHNHLRVTLHSLIIEYYGIILSFHWIIVSFLVPEVLFKVDCCQPKLYQALISFLFHVLSKWHRNTNNKNQTDTRITGTTKYKPTTHQMKNSENGTRRTFLYFTQNLTTLIRSYTSVFPSCAKFITNHLWLPQNQPLITAFTQAQVLQCILNK